MILAGDIGGTKTNLAYIDAAEDRLTINTLQSYPSQRHPSLRDIVQAYVARHPAPITAAAFGIAGPVSDGRCSATNLPWVVDSREIAAQLSLPSVGLINDLEATAYGVLRLDDADRLVLNSGTPVPQGTIAIIAAGTGLGEGGLVWDGTKYKTLPSEGGHADFAPRNELEMDLLRFMLKRYERVSYERLVSGPGLLNIYQFFRERVNYAEPEWLKEQFASGDSPAAISKAALEGKDQACMESLETFVSLYGAEAGNLSLKLLSTGGVYIGGGIAPKILPKMQSGGFMKAFTHKGRFANLLNRMPVFVVLNDKTAIYGAAHYAMMGLSR